MRKGTVTASEVRTVLRTDAKFFLEAGYGAFRRLRSGKWQLRSAAETFGKDAIWMPARFSRIPAASRRFGKPILVPYDCFRYLPWSDDFLSASQVGEYERTEVGRGWLLITRSGRNLGPLTAVDSYLADFTVSDDMIRVAVDPSEDSFYFLGFMHTCTACTAPGSLDTHLCYAA